MLVIKVVGTIKGKNLFSCLGFSYHFDNGHTLETLVFIIFKLHGTIERFCLIICLTEQESRIKTQSKPE